MMGFETGRDSLDLYGLEGRVGEGGRLHRLGLLQGVAPAEQDNREALPGQGPGHSEQDGRLAAASRGNKFHPHKQ